jgi:hypothetical protein
VWPCVGVRRSVSLETCTRHRPVHVVTGIVVEALNGWAKSLRAAAALQSKLAVCRDAPIDPSVLCVASDERQLQRARHRGLTSSCPMGVSWIRASPPLQREALTARHSLTRLFHTFDKVSIEQLRRRRA